jgi:hypothetical protein
MTNPLKLAAEARESVKRRYGPGVQLLLELAEAIERLVKALECCASQRNRNAIIAGVQELIVDDNAELDAILKEGK